MTLENLKDDYDWCEAFRAAGANIDQVKVVIAAVDGANDESNWEGIFEMQDGKLIYLGAWCDYTGWYCQAGGSFIEKDSLEEVISKITLGQDTRDLFRDQLKDYAKDWG